MYHLLWVLMNQLSLWLGCYTWNVLVGADSTGGWGKWQGTWDSALHFLPKVAMKLKHSQN